MSRQTPEPVPTPHADAGEMFNYALLRNLVGFAFRAVRRHRILAIFAFTVVVTLAILSLAVMPKRWQVQATVLAQRSPLMGSLSNPTVNRDWDAPTRAAREVVLRRDNLVSLCQETNFVKRYLETRAPIVRARDWLTERMGAAPRTEDEMTKDLVDTLERRLWVMVNNDGVVTITFEWSDRDLTYAMVEAALQSFLEARHLSEISIVGETVAILEGHAARLQKDITDLVPVLEAREAATRRTTTPRRRIVTSPPTVPRDEEGARLESVLAARKRALSDLEDFRQRRLAELQGQLTQNESLYAPQHPAILSLQQNIEMMSSPSPQVTALRSEVQNIERDLARRGYQASSTGSGLASPAQIQAELADLTAGTGDDARSEYERSQLRLLFRQYSNVVDRLDSARVELDTAQAAFKHRYSVIEPPQLPKRPIKPNPPVVILGALVGGFLFALFSASVADILSGRVLESWQVEHGAGVIILAERVDG